MKRLRFAPRGRVLNTLADERTQRRVLNNAKGSSVAVYMSRSVGALSRLFDFGSSRVSYVLDAQAISYSTIRL